MTNDTRVDDSSANGTFAPLLAGLVAILVLSPILIQFRVLSTILISIMLVAGVLAVGRSPRTRRIVIAGMLIALAVRWLALVRPADAALAWLAPTVTLCYLIGLTAIVLRAVICDSQVSVNTVVGAICGYLLIAFVFAFAFVAVNRIEPGAISVTNDESRSAFNLNQSDGCIYFSFVTLTTLGFGDIVPIHPAAKSLVILEVLTGQVYLTAILARLVGIMRVRPKT